MILEYIENYVSLKGRDIRNGYYEKIARDAWALRREDGS